MSIKLYTADGQRVIAQLQPLSAEVSETAGGAYTLDMTYPMDGPVWQELRVGALLKSPVPTKKIHSFTMPAAKVWEVTAEELKLYATLPYYTRAETPLDAIRKNPANFAYNPSRQYYAGDYCTFEGYIYLAYLQCKGIYPTNAAVWGRKASIDGTSTGGEWIYQDGQVIATLAQGDQFFVESDYNENYVKGYTSTGAVGYVLRTGITDTGADAQETVIPEQEITEQFFRIIEVSVNDSNRIVNISANHVSYDFAGNMLFPAKVTNADAATAISVLKGSLAEDDDRIIASDVTDANITTDWSFINPVQALLDPDTGLLALMKARLYRNNEAFYLLKNEDENPTLALEYGVNLKGVRYTRSVDQQITRVLPYCEDEQSNILFLPELYIDSPLREQIPNQKIEALAVDIRAGETITNSDGTQTVLTLDECYRIMRERATARFTVDEADQPTFDLRVEFLLLGDTEEYKQYKGLQSLNLYDYVKIKHTPAGLDVTSQVVGYNWDVLTERYLSVDLGKAFTTASVAGYNLGSGSVDYSKLAPSLKKRLNLSAEDTSTITATQVLTTSGVTGVKGEAEADYRRGDVNITKDNLGLGNVDNTSDADKPISTATQAALNGKADLVSGKVPQAQLPSYVDDVLEYATKAAFPATGESGKIYVDLSTDLTYRWGGSAYVEISPSLALGETSSTAYRGDRGKRAYDHAQAKGSQFASGLYKIATNAEGHVTGASAVEKADITALGIPGSDTTYDAGAGLALSGTTFKAKLTSETKLSNVAEDGAETYGRLYPVRLDSGGKLAVNVPWIETGIEADRGLMIASQVFDGAGNLKSQTLALDMKSWTKLSIVSVAAPETAGRVYPVALDKNGELAVCVPWTDTHQSLEDYVKKSGDTMTGQLVFSVNGFKTHYASGYYTEGSGNFIHLRNTASDTFNLFANNGTTSVFNVKWESGDTTLAGNLTVNKTSGSNLFKSPILMQGAGITLWNGTWPQINFVPEQNATPTGAIYQAMSSHRVGFLEKAEESDYTEDYLLPTPEVHTTRQWYSILTTKASAGNYLKYKSNELSITSGQYPTSQKDEKCLSFFDKNSSEIGYLVATEYSSGQIGFTISARRNNVYNGMGLTIDASGNKGVYLGSPEQWHKAVNGTTQYITTLGISDLNAFFTAGLWQVAGNTANAPVNNPCFVLQMGHGTDRWTQIAWRSTDTVTKTIYMRKYYSGAWGSWTIVAGEYDSGAANIGDTSVVTAASGVMYRRKGDIVQLAIRASLKTNLANGSSAYIAQMPSGCYSAYGRRTFIQAGINGGNSEQIALFIDSSGRVQITNRSGSAVSAVTGDFTYMVTP